MEDTIEEAAVVDYRLHGLWQEIGPGHEGKTKVSFDATKKKKTLKVPEETTLRRFDTISFVGENTFGYTYIPTAVV